MLNMKEAGKGKNQDAKNASYQLQLECLSTWYTSYTFF